MAKKKLSKYEKEFDFTGPVPGQSLTTPLNARPYTRPPQYTTTKDVLEYYLKAIMTKEGKMNIVDALTSGMPVADVVEDLVGVGAMEGVHNLDSSVLVAPALVEAVAMIGDEYKVEYKFGLPNEIKEETIRPSFIDSILANLEDEDEFADVDYSQVEATEEPIPVEPSVEPSIELPVESAPLPMENTKGLMSRRPANG